MVSVHITHVSSDGCFYVHASRAWTVYILFVDSVHTVHAYCEG